MGKKRYELTDSEWKRIKDLLPPEHPKEGKRGRPAKCDNRTALNGMLWIARGGAPWRTSGKVWSVADSIQPFSEMAGYGRI